METYLKKQDINCLVEAIREAEHSTSGEIRIHIDTNKEGNPAERAWEVFQILEMHKTKERNAVLFHINFELKYLTIIGDEGIHHKVKQEFWDRLHDKTTALFAKGIYTKALENAVREAGIELKRHFPTYENKINELSDDVTFS